ncbi:AaceriAER448Wp [[Ashbya] aceris (nom. inval.)]|nr:AaceriAER448Wp [[Ashbya] aceris (nom. inval.)]
MAVGSKMYQLSSTLLGHQQDVRSVVAISDAQVASGSRDGTVRVWTRDISDPRLWSGAILHQTDKYVNAICYEENEQLVFFGGQEQVIGAVSPLVLEVQDASYLLAGHAGNVCALEAHKGQVVSSSWDETARVWREGTEEHTLSGHKATVWHAVALSDGRFLTASADKTIKLWDGVQELATYNVHTDAVRCLALAPDGQHFASCSNDGTVKVHTIEGKTVRTLEGHESFVYCVRYLPDGALVSCGEDKTVRVWDASGHTRQVIRLPATSIWSLDVLPDGDIVVGSSDGAIRIFTMDSTRTATSEELEKLREDVASTAINAKVMDFDESKLSPYETIQAPGKTEGQVVVVKAPSGVIEAHQYSAGQWAKVGDVVGSSGSDRKTEFQGKMYDYVFDVDIEDGAPPLKLALNANDNPYDVADKFIAQNDLPVSYKNQVVEFILKNSQGLTLEQQGPSNEGAQPTLGRARQILPVTVYLTLDNFNPDTLFKGITKLNTAENRFDDKDLAAIATALQDIPSNYELLYANANIIHSSWSSKVPAYDIMRLLVRYLPSADGISAFVDSGFDSKDPVISMLTIRLLSNAFANPDWGINLMSSAAMYNSIFELIDADYPSCPPKQQSAMAVAIATLIYNYSVLVVKENNHEVLAVVAEVLNNKYGSSPFILGNEEAAYRLLVAFGNLSTVERTLEQFAPSLSWLKNLKGQYAHLPKFQDILNDI